MRLRLSIAYDGAPFAGWQRQSAADTIQARIEAAFEKITQTPATLHGAGRTDAGVHAHGQVAHVDIDRPALDPKHWCRALNANLPPTIRINSVRRAPSNFHARFSALGKIYRYDIFTRDILPPHLHQRVWHVTAPIDLDTFRRALSLYEGRHDFRALAANRSTPVLNTVREIHSVRLNHTPNSIRITYAGTGFLYKMIRILTASALRVARGRESIDWLEDFLLHPTRPKSSKVAPPDGLTLVRVRY
ncbi:MAG: tRNA pseudouridine(38-40) synthase TruA [Chthoniobacterales bacterium]